MKHLTLSLENSKKKLAQKLACEIESTNFEPDCVIYINQVDI